LNLKPFHLIGQTALPSVQALTALTNALMLKKMSETTTHC